MEIDLGKQMESPATQSDKPEPDEPSTHYPCFYVDDADWLSKIPDQGTMTVQYSKSRHSQTTTGDGETSHSGEIEIQKILDVSEGEAPDRDKSREDALDSLAKEAKSAPADEEENEEDEE